MGKRPTFFRDTPERDRPNRRSPQARNRLRELSAANGTRPCMVDGCPYGRNGMSHYCRHHKNQRSQYGHPLARAIKPQEFKREREIAHAFCVQYAEHPAMVAALAVVDGWLRDAKANLRVPAARYFAILAGAGVRGQQIIEITLALWLFSRWQPRTLPDDERLDCQVAHHIFLLLPVMSYGRRVPTGSVPRHDTGKHLRRMLAPFIANALAAIQAERTAISKSADQLRVPFITDSSTNQPKE